MLSKASSLKAGCYACQWLENADMHKFAKFDHNISCGSSYMSIFTNWTAKNPCLELEILQFFV